MWTTADLRTVGFFAKKLAPRPEEFVAPGVDFVCSVCDCSVLTASPEGWIDRWLHNGLWFFDRLETLDRVVPPADSAAFLRYGLRMLPVRFDEDGETPLDLSVVSPEPIPADFVRLGYDLCSRAMGNTLECSPLSCNLLATEWSANRWCLLDSFDDALRAAAAFPQGGAEPGPYVLLEVWSNVLPDELARRLARRS
jgi:hypothetical protein